ncbi:unnamed protein product [Arabis nemorensis]|uniref:peroxidase n=1 Tax=Arabis nemorensis TaxID=586526 RepID=A0A565CTI8_9BRAS|nr:unnamed protein product [Arabis nemorensis]
MASFNTDSTIKLAQKLKTLYLKQEGFNKNSSIAPAMIRLYFHDCFSDNGCDASLLLDGTSSEKKASPNLSVRGYELIDDVKSVVEKECPNVVSCADIIAMATRDHVTLASGRKIKYEIPTGRHDGLVSLASTIDLPSPRLTVSDTVAKFAKENLSLTDMVLLLGMGGHTIGVTHCSFIMDPVPALRDGQWGLCFGPAPNFLISLKERGPFFFRYIRKRV